MARKTLLPVVVLAVLGSALTPPIPAGATGDTTPPSLISMSVSPYVVDTSSASQSVTVTAVITDDLSGVCSYSDVDCTYGTSVSLWSGSGAQSVGRGFGRVSGDTYAATLTLPQFAEDGIWRDWSVSLCDKATNCSDIDTYDLMRTGLNVAVGVGTFQVAYPRTVSLRLRRAAVLGTVDADLASACFWYVPVTVMRRTAAGWKKVGTTVTSFTGRFRVRTRGLPGKYRATATQIGLGTPTVTTCSSALSKTLRLD